MRLLRRILAALTILAGLAAALPLSAGATARRGSEAGAWVLRGWTTKAEDVTDQGLATLTLPGGGTRLVTRGDDSIPPRLAAQGWRHVGDPDSRAGYLLDAYQGSSSASTKLFVLTSPTGRQTLLVHRLLPGEQYNNSFAAISPDGRWFVSGEWGTMSRLLVFAMPAPSAHGVRPLPLAGVIRLAHPVRNVQGCAFASPTSLACSTNDPGRSLFGVPRQLLDVRLDRPVHGGTNAGTVSLLGAVPTMPVCGGKEEVEGIDVHGGRLRVAVVTACTKTTTIFTYRLEPAGAR